MDTWDVETAEASAANARVSRNATPNLSVSIPIHSLNSQSAQDLYNGGNCDSLLTPSRPLSYPVDVEHTPESMPSIAKRSTVKLLPSLPAPSGRGRPAERIIDRKALLDGAPDREDLLLRTKNVEDVRQALKIGVKWSQWMMDNKTSTHPTAQHTGDPDDANASLARHSSQDKGKTAEFQTWPRRTFSTGHQLVSPEPLGPTHLLIISGSIVQPNKKRVCLECPINGLVLLINCPNIANPAALTHRTPGDLARVLINVPHAKPFAHLVAYFHTRDQVALFKQLLPGWLWELLHQPSFGSSPASGPASPDSHRSFFPPLARTKTKPKLGDHDEIGLGVRKRSWLSSLSSASDEAKSIALGSRGPSSTSLNLPGPTISKAIADASSSGRDLDLMQSVACLQELQDNLRAIGLYSADLWAEMELTEVTIIRAINLRAKAAGMLVD